MYLSDRDLAWAIKCGRLIIKPEPEKIDATSIDLHLDGVEKARVWDMARFKADKSDSGDEALELRAGQIHYKNFSRKYQIPVPDDEGQLVFRRHNQIISHGRTFTGKSNGIMGCRTPVFPTLALSRPQSRGRGHRTEDSSGQKIGVEKELIHSQR